LFSVLYIFNNSLRFYFRIFAKLSRYKKHQVPTGTNEITSDTNNNGKQQQNLTMKRNTGLQKI